MSDNYTSLSYARSMASMVTNAIAGKFAFVKGKLAEIFGNNSRAATSNIRIGFAVRKEGEQNERMIVLSEENVDADKVKEKSFNDVACVDLALKEEILEEGTYTYRTFIDYGNGQIEYSSNSQTVTLNGEVHGFCFYGPATVTKEDWEIIDGVMENYQKDINTNSWHRFNVYTFSRDGKTHFALWDMDCFGWYDGKISPLEIGIPEKVLVHEENHPDRTMHQRKVLSSEVISDTKFRVKIVYTDYHWEGKYDSNWDSGITYIFDVDMASKTAHYSNFQKVKDGKKGAERFHSTFAIDGYLSVEVDGIVLSEDWTEWTPRTNH